MVKRVLIIAGLAGLLLGAAADAAGWEVQGRPDPRSRATPGEARDMREAGDVVPATRVVGEVRRRHPRLRELSDVQLIRGAEPRYVVIFIDENGNRREAVFDARTGRMLFER